MSRPQQRYRGVRQRHWGSWVSEIRHPSLKTRVWLGTFETAEDAARAYDEAARLMCGPTARTNFPYNATESQSSTRFLSSALIAKLQRCHMTSLTMSHKPGTTKVENKDHQISPLRNRGNFDMSVDMAVDKGESTAQQFKSLEDEHIEQMIEELLDYGSIELSSCLQE